MKYSIVTNMSELMKKANINTDEEFIEQSILKGQKISRPTLRKIKNGKNLETLTFETIIKVCIVLNCHPNELLEVKFTK